MPLRPTSRIAWTAIGCLSMPLWATWPLLAALTRSAMPDFQFLTVIFATAALALAAFEAWSGERAATAGPSGGILASRGFSAAAVGIALILVNLLFLQAIRHISLAQANLTVYLWPIWVVLLCLPLGLVRLRRVHGLGLVLGLVGAALVIGAGDGSPNLAGVALAFGGGFSWAIYAAFRAWQGDRAPEALAAGMALAALVSLALHLGFETTVRPPATALVLAMVVGIFPLGFGNLAWDHGVRKGNRVFLATAAYATPLFASTLLALAGLATATPGLVAGAVLIVTAGVLASR